MESYAWADYHHLERSVRGLNTTDADEVKAFIRHWAAVSPDQSSTFPPLASQGAVPRIDILKRQNGCTWTGGGSCDSGHRCCGAVDDGWCCPSDSECCPDGHRGCCDSGEICCAPDDGDPFCCDGDQACDNVNLKCSDQTVTETYTTTVWETETDTETVSEDATTTVELTNTRDSTVRITVSNVDTGTTTVTKTKTVTDASSSTDFAKRFMITYPAPTQTSTPSDTAPSPVFYVRPASSLDALAEVLIRRGVSIQRRATVTETDWITESSTTTVTDTETETEWYTEWDTSVVVDKFTITNYANAKEMVTKTETVTKHVQPSDTKTDDSNDSDSDGLSGGTIAGAAIAGVAGLVLLLTAVWWWRRRGRRGQDNIDGEVHLQPVMAQS